MTSVHSEVKKDSIPGQLDQSLDPVPGFVHLVGHDRAVADHPDREGAEGVREGRSHRRGSAQLHPDGRGLRRTAEGG